MSSERKDYADLYKADIRELFVRSSAQALTGTYAMQAVGEPFLQLLDANGAARNVKLPTVTGNKGKMMLIINPTGAANSLTLQDSGGNALSPALVVAQNKTMIVICDGTTWRGLLTA